MLNGKTIFAAEKLRGFTLIELLTVIAIIGILASMLLVVLPTVMNTAKKTEAKQEVNQLLIAIEQYDQTYSHFPVSSVVQQSGWTNVTYGGVYNNTSGIQWPSSPAPVSYVTSNSDVIAILMNMTNFPNSSVPTANANCQKNPMQTPFLSAKMVSDTASPGVGTDLNYRDPWGNPYIISINLNANNNCEDLFYSSPAVSSATKSSGGNGLNGLIFQPDGNYAFHGNVMVWSMGPYGPFNHNSSSFNAMALATDPSNKQHIMSWVQ